MHPLVPSFEVLPVNSIFLAVERGIVATYHSVGIYERTERLKQSLPVLISASRLMQERH